ncbi:uncharacterized protein LOC26536223 [Drosophila yakuba]|uniref:Uncharacterized protein n=1 Tax=Drosophila yakuba TaxID=7245 RepID=A0A0R1DTK9_DROYA|nr:uncharacterized protein LOC26536223 [Drosophila yakuba]KRK00473.1 uncharacterized protein Dyak_GE29042 [Drosophila yakuba]
MFRGAYKILTFLKTRETMFLCKRRPFSDLFDKGGRGSGGIDTYHVKHLQGNKGKEARIMELTAQIESLEMQIKALEKSKSAEAKAAKGELILVLKELKQALRNIRMNK